MVDLFSPVGSGGNFRHNAILTHPEDDGMLGQGYVAARDALVQFWQEHGPDDRIFLPIIMNYRQGIELLLKDGIRFASACLWADGIREKKLTEPGLRARA